LGPQDVGRGYRYIDIFVPELLATVIASLALMNLPATLTLYRDRLEGYSVMIPAQLLVHFVTFVAASVLVCAVAWPLYGIRFGGSIALVVFGDLLCVAALFATGVVLGQWAKTIKVTRAVGSALFFVMLATSGASAPRSEFPDWLRQATEYLPLTMVVDVMTGLWTGVSLFDLTRPLVLLGLLLAAAIIAASFSPGLEPVKVESGP
jgi:ABC-2 type transport system permease protein